MGNSKTAYKIWWHEIVGIVDLGILMAVFSKAELLVNKLSFDGTLQHTLEVSIKQSTLAIPKKVLRTANVWQFVYMATKVPSCGSLYPQKSKGKIAKGDSFCRAESCFTKKYGRILKSIGAIRCSLSMSYNDVQCCATSCDTTPLYQTNHTRWWWVVVVMGVE